VHQSGMVPEQTDHLMHGDAMMNDVFVVLFESSRCLVVVECCQ